MDLKNVPDIRKREIIEKDYYFEGRKLDEIKGILIPSSEYSERMRQIGNELIEIYSEKNPMFLYVLNGSAQIHSDLFGHLSHNDVFPHTQCYAKVKSTDGTKTGDAKYSKEIYETIELMPNKDVVIIEDIIDTGGTIKGLIDIIKEKNINVKSLSVCAATYKIEQLKDENKGILEYVNHVGFIIPNYWIVGQGLDLNGKYRELKGIWVLTDETIKKNN